MRPSPLVYWAKQGRKAAQLTTNLSAQLAEAEKSAKAIEGNLKELEYDLA